MEEIIINEEIWISGDLWNPVWLPTSGAVGLRCMQGTKIGQTAGLRGFTALNEEAAGIEGQRLAREIFPNGQY